MVRSSSHNFTISRGSTTDYFTALKSIRSTSTWSSDVILELLVVILLAKAGQIWIRGLNIVTNIRQEPTVVSRIGRTTAHISGDTEGVLSA